MNFGARLYRRLLRLYPADYRAEFGAQMLEAFEGLERDMRARGLLRHLRFLLAEVWALLSQAILQRLPWRPRPASSGTPRGLGRWIGRGIDIWAQDLRHAVRGLGRNPVLTLAVVTTLAIGIGANTAIFSIVKTVLLEPLPYRDADRLVTIGRYPWTPAEIVLGMSESGGGIEQVAGFYPQRFAITGAQEPFELEGAQISPNFFALLHTRMALGRDFVPADARRLAPRTAVISHGVWQRRYGGADDVIGRGIRINGQGHEIIGVLERGFRQFAPRSDDPGLWIPLAIEPTRADGSIAWAIPLARLAEGVPLSRAQAELDVLVARFLQKHAELQGSRWDLQLATLKSELVRNARAALVLLQLAVGLLLLLACANVANLLLVRFTSRRSELAVRSALGASKGRLVRQLVTETMVHYLLGGLAAMLLLLVGLELVLVVAPAEIPRIGEVAIDVSIFGFTLATLLITGLAFGVIPAIASTRQILYGSLKEDGRSTTGTARKHRISQTLVVAQVTLTLILVVGAALLVRSFVSLAGQEPGFRTDDVLAVPIRVPENRYDSVPELEEFYRRTLERLRRTPSVANVGVSNNLPLRRGGSSREFNVQGEGESRVAQYGVVSPGYFGTLEIPIVSGRAFDDSDRRENRPVVIIDQAMGSLVWPGQDPLGKRFRFTDEQEWMVVVGVVGNIRGSGLANDPRAGFYIPYQQRPENPVELAVGRNAVFLIRSQLSGSELAALVRESIWEIDPRQPVREIATLGSIISAAVSPQRFRAVLLGSFAGIALILAIASIYGVIQYLVAERTHEFGIRRALGATSTDIVWRVLRWGLQVTTLGVALGLVGVFTVNRYLESLLFHVTPTDPLTLLSAVGVVIIAALAACLQPARTATRIEPIIALRAEH